jgi:hypothetical protein
MIISGNISRNNTSSSSSSGSSSEGEQGVRKRPRSEDETEKSQEFDSASITIINNVNHVKDKDSKKAKHEHESSCNNYAGRIDDGLEERLVSKSNNVVVPVEHYGNHQTTVVTCWTDGGAAVGVVDNDHVAKFGTNCGVGIKNVVDPTSCSNRRIRIMMSPSSRLVNCSIPIRQTDDAITTSGEEEEQEDDDHHPHVEEKVNGDVDIYMDNEIDHNDDHGATEDILIKPSIMQQSQLLKEIIGLCTMFILNVLITIWLLTTYFLRTPSVIACSLPPRHHPYIIPPSQTYRTLSNASCHGQEKKLLSMDRTSNVTLRQFLSHPDGFHLGIAPAFFGFYVYFGALTALSEHVLTEKDKEEGRILLPHNNVCPGNHDDVTMWNHTDHVMDSFRMTTKPPLLKSVAGASAGAMAAVLLAAGLNPRDSAEFAAGLSVDKFWDFPGFGGILKGELFEEIMIERLRESRTKLKDCGGDSWQTNESSSSTTGTTTSTTTLNLEHGWIPVAVTAFDILNLQPVVLTKGCMGKAARASATFPGLFQPCAWVMDGTNNDDEEESCSDWSSNIAGVEKQYRRYLIDGGLWDMHGLEGLGHLRLGEKKKRILNMVAGSYGIQGPPGPSRMKTIHGVTEVVSLSIENTPRCGPWAMKNGPRAVEAARNAIISVLDVPMYQGDEEGHYVLHVDATAFVPPTKDESS